MKKVIYFFLVSCIVLACSNAHKKSEVSEVKQTDSVNVALPNQITFNEHVAKVIYQNCGNCHRNGATAPFPLTNYAEVYRKKRTIAKVVEKGIMPPWPADASYSHFVGEMLLSSYDKQLIVEWVNQGAKEGEEKYHINFPEFPQGSQIAKPDLVIKMPKKFLLKGDNKDNYWIMKIPFEIPKSQYVKMIEFVPGNRKLVHHVNGYMVVYEDHQKKNVNDGELVVPNYEYTLAEAWKKLKIANDDGSFPMRIPSVTNYLPGVTPALYPEGIGGFEMKRKGAILLYDIHYGPTPVDAYDQSTFNIFFSKKAPKRKIKEFQLGTYGLSKITPELMVPPDSIKTFNTQYTLTEDMSLLTINPHMHLLGKELIAYAVTPENKKVNLIRIPRWDFRWQYFYTFPKMLVLKKGSTIYVEATFDNTKANPNNPFSPPKWVGARDGSMSTKDEMLQFIITYLPYQSGDENRSLAKPVL
ncbi:MAG: hypothetical protein RI952_1065 [Bacteroidota bacterium]